MQSRKRIQKRIQAKRILSVKIKHIVDDSPDTSYLSEYSNHPTSEFSIDRRHSEDCDSVREDIKQTKQTLEHVQQTIGDFYHAVLAQYNGTLANEKLDAERDELHEAYELVGELIEDIDACDCVGHGVMERGQYRYFNGPIENYEGESAENIRKYVRQDYDRMERYNAGDWHYIGVRAEADILTNDVIQHVTSSGLWGIESDSDREYIQSVEQEELSNLKTELRSLGFSTRAISQSFKSIEEVSE